jgi:hypothetical protein
MMRNSIVCLCALLVLSGCYTQRKAERQVLKAQARYPEVVANYCGNWYPPKEVTVTKTEYKPGATVYHSDTVKVDCDSVVKAGAGGNVVYLPCPPRSERVDTFYSTNTKTVENTARITALQQSYNKEHDRAEQLLVERNIWRVVALVCIAAIGIYAVIKFVL